MPAATVAAMQQAVPSVIYGSSNADSVMEYKLAAYHQRQPDILILGNSIMLSVRSRFFNLAPDAVYNGAGGGWGLPQIQAFSRQLGHKPRVIIIGLDFEWFQDATGAAQFEKSIGESVALVETMRHGLVKTTQSLIGGELSLKSLLRRRDPFYHRDNLGINAIAMGTGFRADGSIQQGALAADRARQSAILGATLERYGQDRGKFVPGSSLYAPAFSLIKELLASWRADNITVIGISGPFPHAITALVNEAEKYEHIGQAVETMRKLFAAYGYDYVYFDDPLALGADNHEWFDGHHLTESMSLRVLLALFRSYPELFSPYSSAETAVQLLADFTNPMDIFHELPT